MIGFERANEIANLYYNDIYHLCLSRLKKEENAADVTQEVFLLFQEKYEGLEDEYIKAWLYKVANNKIKEQFRLLPREKKSSFTERCSIHRQARISFMKWKKKTR